jgi:Domain of unknown function (DUF4434)
MFKQGAQLACVIAATSLATPCRAGTGQGEPHEKPLVTGAFIQMTEGLAAAKKAWWQDQLAAMKAVGMDTVIIQYVGYGDQYFYPTQVDGAVPMRDDPLEHILAAADDTRTRVFMGLQLNDAFWNDEFDSEANLARNSATLNELYRRYRSHPSLAGWYVPEEISDHTPRKPELAEALIEYIGKITALAHETTGLPVMISPYFGQQPDAEAYARWWDEKALGRMNIDILAMQDGVGTHRTTIAESRPVYEALKPVLRRHGVAFWANNESFDQTHGWPVDEDGWAARPVDFDTFMEQVNSTAPFVKKIVTFEFTSYMNPQIPGRSQTLYEAYRAYHASVTGGKQPVTGAQSLSLPAGQTVKE